MAGRKGQIQRNLDKKTLRLRLWKAMRILVRFTLPDLLRVVEGANYHNARKFVAGLVRHGYVAKNGSYIGGRVGERQMFRLVHNTGPVYPAICLVCGKPLSFHCEPQREKNDKPCEVKRMIPRVDDKAFQKIPGSTLNHQ